MVIPASTGLYIQVTTFGVGKAILVDFVYPLPGVNEAAFEPRQDSKASNEREPRGSDERGFAGTAQFLLQEVDRCIDQQRVVRNLPLLLLEKANALYRVVVERAYLRGELLSHERGR